MVSTHPVNNGYRTIWNSSFTLNMLSNEAGSHSLYMLLYLSSPTVGKEMRVHELVGTLDVKTLLELVQ